MKRILLLVIALTLLISLSIPTPAMAWSHWDLEGWRIDAGKWMDGLLFTWYEGDDVPYRLAVRGYDGIDTDITIQHDFKDADGHIGIDYVSLSGPLEPFIGPPTNRTTDPGSIPGPQFTIASGYFTIDGPNPVEVPNGWIQEWVFQLTPAGQAALQDFNSGNWAIYWNAHLAVTNLPGTYGSSYWNGASLHAHTSVTGSQDVPIKTPPQEAPPPPPCIDVEKAVSIDGGSTWFDSDTAPTSGLLFTVDINEPIFYKIVVTNCGETTLENIQLNDVLTKYDSGMTEIHSQVLTIPHETSLTKGQVDEIIVGPVVFLHACYWQNTVTAIGVCAESGDQVDDVDSAWFHIP